MTDQQQTVKPWTPDQKLRADAADTQLNQRAYKLRYPKVSAMEAAELIHDSAGEPWRQVARELASAVSLEKEAELAKWRNLAADFCLSHLGSSTVTTPEAFHKTQSQVALSWRRVMGAQRKELDEKDAEIARLRDAISDASNILRGGPLAGDAVKSFALRIHNAANLLDATDSAREAR